MASSNDLVQFFSYDHLPPGMKEVAEMCSTLAIVLNTILDESDQKVDGLRHLLAAKDAFVRAVLLDQTAASAASVKDDNQPERRLGLV